MASWNVAQIVQDRENEYLLLNKSRTVIRFNKRVKLSPAILMSEMEELGVPIAYTEGLDDIYLTLLVNTSGDYRNNKIRLTCCQESRDGPSRILVHELAHHLD